MSSGPPTKRIRQIAGQSRLSFAPPKIGNYFATVRVCYCLDTNIKVRRKTAQNPPSSPGNNIIIPKPNPLVLKIRGCK